MGKFGAVPFIPVARVFGEFAVLEAVGDSPSDHVNVAAFVTFVIDPLDADIANDVSIAPLLFPKRWLYLLTDFESWPRLEEAADDVHCFAG
jgi:hypothetical protein